MKVLVSEKLSEHKYKTPEGYLICTDAILARTGKQSYTKDELFCDGDNTEVEVDRPYDEVMNAKTIASFENKPITFDHPDEDVNVGNYKSYSVGYVRDVRQGKTDKGEDVILGNLVITDQDAINAIEQGDHTDLSCGYDCDIKDDGSGNYSQTNIRGNHLALCEQGRAGIARIVDSKARDLVNDSEELVVGKWYNFAKKIEVARNQYATSLRISGKSGNVYRYTIYLKNGEMYGSGTYSEIKERFNIKDSKVDSKVEDKLSYETASSDDNYLDEVEKMIYKFANVRVDAMLVEDKLKIAAKNSKGFNSKQLNDIASVLMKNVAVSDITISNPDRFDSNVTAYIVDSKVEDDNWFKGHINGDLQSYNIDSLINNVKSKKQPLHTNLTGKSGNVYTVFIDGSLKSNLDDGSDMWIDIIVEKPNGQQKRLISKKFNSWSECQNIFNTFKNSIRDSADDITRIDDSKIKDEMNYSEEMKAVRNALRHIVVDNKSEMKQLIQDLIDNKPMNYSLEVRRLKRAIDELIKWSDNRQEGIDTIWAIAKENRIVDSKINDVFGEVVWKKQDFTISYDKHHGYCVFYKNDLIESDYDDINDAKVNVRKYAANIEKFKKMFGIKDSVVDSKVEDSLSKKEKELCDYMLENALDDGEDENDLLKKMKLYYSAYSNLARSKPDEVLQYFKSHIDDSKVEDVNYSEKEIKEAAMKLLKQKPFLTYEEALQKVKENIRNGNYLLDSKIEDATASKILYGRKFTFDTISGSMLKEGMTVYNPDKGFIEPTFFKILKIHNTDKSDNKFVVSYKEVLAGNSVGTKVISKNKMYEVVLKIDKTTDSVEDAEYTYKLTKKKNDYDEYVIQAYKNGKKNEDATYYTDDWDDAINTLKSIAKQEKLTFRQQGSVFIADNKAKVFNDSKESMTALDALKMIDLIKKVSK